MIREDVARIRNLLHERAALFADWQRIDTLHHELTIAETSMLNGGPAKDAEVLTRLLDVRERLALLKNELDRVGESIGCKDAVINIEAKMLAGEASGSWLAKGASLRADALKALEGFLLGDLAAGELLVSQLPIVRAAQVRSVAFRGFGSASGQMGPELVSAFLSELERDFAP